MPGVTQVGMHLAPEVEGLDAEACLLAIPSGLQQNSQCIYVLSSSQRIGFFLFLPPAVKALLKTN